MGSVRGLQPFDLRVRTCHRQGPDRLVDVLSHGGTEKGSGDGLVAQEPGRGDLGGRCCQLTRHGPDHFGGVEVVGGVELPGVVVA